MLGYFDALLRYFEFSGRTSRMQYWMFQLFMLTLLVGAVFADFQLTGVLPDRTHLGFFTLFAVIVHVVPGITVTVRRLHDSGRSGWWYWIGLIPIIGGIWLLVLMCKGPTFEADAYGDDPRLGDFGGSPHAAPITRSAELLAAMQARHDGVSRI